MKLENTLFKEVLCAKSFISSLTIEQRYHFFLEKAKQNKLKFNEKAQIEWMNRTTVLNEENFADMLKFKEYDIVAYSNAINEDLTEYENELAEIVRSEKWFQQLNQILTNAFEKDFNYKKEYGYSYIFRPFIIYAREQIENYINSNANFVCFSALKSLVDSLASKLIRMSSKTLILELNISKLKQELKGDTPEERFHSFIEQKGTKENLIEFFNEYSVLAKLMLNETLLFTNNTIELLERIKDNKQTLIDSFNIPTSEFKLRNIQFGEGDTHDKGRSVGILELESGQKIVYKPKKLQIVNAYNQLIKRLNQEKNLLKINTVESIIKEDYTFEKFVESKPCNSEKEVENYYERFGQILGIMYMINGNDLHMENVIASGEHPYIVDLETIFQSQVSFNYPETADLKNRFIMQRWVNSTLMLPERILHTEVGDKIELSALSGKEQVLSKKDYRLKNDFTDNAKYELAPIKLFNSKNLVYLNNKLVDYKDYVNHLIKGFVNVLQFFYNHKDELLREGGLIQNFKDLRIRLIFRNTHIYARFLNSIYHPDYLRDYYYLEQIFENLWVYPISNKHLIEAEYRDLMRGDIPIFFTETSTLSVFDSDNSEYENELKITGMDLVVKKIKDLSQEDIKRQVSIIRIKTETASINKHKTEGKFEIVSDKEKVKKELIEQAINIGDKIAEHGEICEESQTMSWITVNDDEEKMWDVSPIGGELYQGLAGISLFYHYLYKLTNEKKYKKYRDYSYNMSMKIGMTSKYNSGLQGFASLLYPSLKVLESGPGRKYKQGIQEVYTFLDKSIDVYSGVDWMHGKSSVIELLMLAYEYNKDEEYLYLATRYAQRVLNEIKKTNIISGLGGLSHGYSGLAATFTKIGYLTKREDLLDFGLDMLLKDQQLFDEKVNGWKDLRKEDMSPSHYWCHGSVGIGLSRLKMIKYLDDGNLGLLKDIKLVKNALDKLDKPLNDDCLCHGNMGIADFYLELYLYTNKTEHYEKALSIGQYVLKNKFNIVEFDGFLPVGLFKGLAGIGYEFLRIVNPQNVPSVLILN
ncbi:type 2 lantibiotic biosynthesis LanM family protein [Anoxybacillus sp. B7M1]|uniref:type 2 lanthipeptide synthetase LanM family protein n=1 Tax=unclassified Anoxybacillus TaxID=2639704 RepID=UPI0005CDC2CC|nr:MULTISPECIES: type 2 lanthipeptide synthetase LanM family protein [unclassified Anoxybacillus]ANB56360.1 type 2 lantibiotic biosynthesis LanM family protein [Anoxybacillus sp. B2M1]ANB65664.1 type 2 lantibiotic biosynthesis LanM family protein [Anoxybacillus sp. B7M1]